MKVEGIKTDLGNKILEDLLSQGWEKIDEYNLLAFDKGVDFDSYTLRKGRLKLEFEWTNWFEWTIVGAEAELGVILEMYELN